VQLTGRQFYLAGAAALAFVCLLCCGAVATADAQVYKDPKGLFTMTPPEGWVRKDYPQETRSRVRFTSPDGKGSIGILIRPAEPEEAVFEQLLAEKKANLENLRREFPTGRFVISEGSFCGHRCVKLETRIPGKIVQENYLYVDQGIHFNLDYNAPDQEDFEQYREIGSKSLCTIRGRR